MKIEIFDPSRFAATGQFFADEDPTRFAYHGTSTLHASSIEQEGFRPYVNLLEPADLIALSQSIPDPTHRTIAWLQQEAVGQKRLSFAPYALRAASYAMAGQTVRVIHDAKAAGGTLPSAIETFMQQIQQAQPCLYVIDFADLAGLDITLEHGVIHCATPIPASRIAAKMILPSDLHGAVQAALEKQPSPYLDPYTPLGATIWRRRLVSPSSLEGPSPIWG